MNYVILIGRVGRTPELSEIGDGKKVVNFSVATTEYFNGNKDTSWHNIEIWGEYGEKMSKLINIGNQISVTGRIKYKAYEKNDVKCVASSIVANRIELLDSKKSDQNSEESYNDNNKEQEKQVSTNSSKNDYETDDLPF